MKIKVHTKQVEKHLNTIYSILDKHGQEIMKEIGDKGKFLIQNRTKRGFDVNNKEFKRLKNGKRSTLTQTGKMLESIKVQSSNRVVRIYVGKQNRGRITNFGLATVHNFGRRAGRGKGFKMPKREFFGLNDKDWRKLKLLFKKLFYDFLRGKK